DAIRESVELALPSLRRLFRGAVGVFLELLLSIEPGLVCLCALVLHELRRWGILGRIEQVSRILDTRGDGIGDLLSGRVADRLPLGRGRFEVLFEELQCG